VFEFKLPDVGEGIHEGEIVAWKVKEGDVVKADQPLVDVMTDKATVEITSPRAGRIAKLAAKEGQQVKVGEVIVVIDTEAEQGSARPGGTGGSARESAAGAPTAQPQRATEPAPTAAPPKAEEKKEKTLFELPEGVAAAYQPKAGLAHAQRNKTQAGGAAPTPVSVAAGPVLAAPATRRLARELGVDLATVRGTGPAGRVERADVEAAARAAPRTTAPGAGAVAPAVTIAPTSIPKGPGQEERIPLKGLRKRISERMTESKRHAAHYAYVEEVDVTDLVKLRDHAKEIAEHKGVKLTFLPFVLKAAAHALKKHPLVNASLDESTGEIVLKKYYNLGVAAATPDGLIVPVVKNVDRLHILDIAREVERLAEAAKSGKSKLEDLQGGTFTVTSLGKMGGLFAIPVINYPEVAIMGVHKIEKRPVVAKDGHSIVVRDMMNLSFSFDHRIVDGAIGAEFAHTLIRYLEHPNLLLLEGL